MQLVIAEKPSVAQQIASVIGAEERKDGYMEGSGSIVSWCVGHLVELAQPDAYSDAWKKWTYESLPMIPENWQHEVKRDTAAQYKVLRELMHDTRVDSVVCATDAGREGELIFRLVYEMAGCNKPMKRLWISSMEESAIRDGFANLKPGSDYDCLYQSALCRQRADWLVGLNGTRLFTVLYGGKVLKVGRVQTPTLGIPDIKNNPKAMEVIAQLVAKLPEMEIDGVMSEEMEARVWELRMPGLDKAGQLAVELDRFVYDYDIYSYRNDVHSMTENIAELTEMLNQGDTEHITEWLNEAISEGAAPEEEERAKELLEKLAEYTPLAKIEENAINGMEEQNYNMVDDVQGTGDSSFNNGVGEKAQKEAAKREQEQPAARISLKARLAEKKAQVAGQNQDHDAQENSKNNQREM